MTFTMYVFHLPLLYFLVALGPFNPQLVTHNFALWGTVWALVYLISRVSEAKKHLYRRLYDAVAQRLLLAVGRTYD